MHVWPQDIEKNEHELVVSARIEIEEQAPQILWYRLPLSHESALSPNSDPFAVATVLLAMSQASKLVIHGEVSPSLLHNLEEFQAIWASWLPEQLFKIPIVAEHERESVLSHDVPSAISAFSGGVDSSYTVFRHALEVSSRYKQPLQAGLLVHGFDIPISQPDTFERAKWRAAQMLNSAGLELLTVATNFRAVMDRYINWENSFGSAVASCLLMLQGRFRIGLIPSSYSYRDLTFPYGSNPLTDLLMGSNSFSIVHDGAEYGRFGKVKAISGWPEALEHLRVCWQGQQLDRNCCRCEKCIRNILTFRLVQDNLPSCFEVDVSDNQIRNLRMGGGALDALEFLRDEARRQGISSSWVKAVETAVRRNRRPSLLRKIDKSRLKQNSLVKWAIKYRPKHKQVSS